MHIASIGIDLRKTTFHLVSLGERNKPYLSLSVGQTSAWPRRIRHRTNVCKQSLDIGLT